MYEYNVMGLHCRETGKNEILRFIPQPSNH